ncbi:uncharacterized protein BT62DRAFT_995167 [Guyanagaster necrorhizus]|uniref:Uncharacterized protein n=1 Tax=Guyanagaster necrorhizus TaxID=856835 RepID=A0A9P7VNV8_9AGAR|nr:uncharacterized protein BT62DRAFT_995167 [Guyanagaster necrorhizus MCA 3950]KAG7444646.1 hypothetical protein BT62DRAFT_995167 [Guyanagaster necrorhizus MCA 3950]
MSKTESQAFSFPRPASPTKEALRPNAHPYPIKTTSTGVLTRSNSNASPQQQSTAHHYVPSSSPGPSRSNSSPKLNGRGHRYSRSLSSDLPRPLPIPPPSPSHSIGDVFSDSTSEGSSDRKPKRSETLPTPPGVGPRRLPALDDLPTNPKSWTPSQLSLYLSTTLKVRSGETLQLPAPVAQDIATFVRESRITGRSFLHMKEEDLEQFQINKLWRSALLSASRSLRQNVLKGRIWGFGNGIDGSPYSVVDVSDDEHTPNGHLRRRSSSLSETYSSNLFVNGSASSEDLENIDTPIRRSLKGKASGGRYRNGRVKGMVETFERSNSVDEGLSDGHSPRERSGSNASTSSGSSIYETADSAHATVKPRPLPATPSDSSLSVSPPEEEPSMEALLANSHLSSVSPFTERLDSSSVTKRPKKRRGGAVGVHAWEAEAEDNADGEGGVQRVTVKRVLPVPGTGVEDLFALGPVAKTMVDVGVGPLPEEPVPAVDAHARAQVEELEKDLETTKQLIEKLKLRLEAVEKDVESMEKAEAEREREAELKGKERQEEKERAQAYRTTQLEPQTYLGKIFHALFGARSMPFNGGERPRFLTSSYYERFVEPTTLSGLPSYILLVGLGVCAVVLRVLIRRSLIVVRRR